MTLAQLWITGSFDPTYFDSTYFDCGTQVNIRIYDIVEKGVTRSIVHELMTGSDYVQSLGIKSRIFTIRGLLIGVNRVSDRATLRAGVNDIGTFVSEGVPSLTVFIREVNFRERGEKPLEYDVEIGCVEVNV